MADAGYEKTTRLTPTWTQGAADYVKDTDEWIARCLARVSVLDPVIANEEALQAVRDMSGLERWRLMKPESAADQLYAKVPPQR